MLTVRAVQTPSPRRKQMSTPKTISAYLKRGVTLIEPTLFWMRCRMVICAHDYVASKHHEI